MYPGSADWGRAPPRSLRGQSCQFIPSKLPSYMTGIESTMSSLRHSVGAPSPEICKTAVRFGKPGFCESWRRNIWEEAVRGGAMGLKVAVVGAGIGGLTTAIALRRVG